MPLTLNLQDIPATVALITAELRQGNYTHALLWRHLVLSRIKAPSYYNQQEYQGVKEIVDKAQLEAETNTKQALLNASHDNDLTFLAELYALLHPQNQTHVLDCLDKAIALEHAEAMSKRALMHEKGQGGSQDYLQAIAFYEQAIILKNASAMHNRAVMHQRGLGGPKDYPRAIALYEQAIALEHAAAMHNRAFMHQQGLGGPKDYPRAIALYEQAIALGNANAMNNRALMHKKGQGGPQDYPKALALYERAIALGYATAMFNRALMHEKDLRGPQDYPKVIALYEQAIALGHASAMANRAIMHHQGQGSLQDYSKAVALFEQAIALGHANAMFNRALMHETGQGGSQDYPKAIALYEQAIALGHVDAMHNRAAIDDSQLTTTEVDSLLTLLWPQLLKPQISLSTKTIALFKKHCQSEMFQKLSQGKECSLYRLSQLLNNPSHPVHQTFAESADYQQKFIQHIITTYQQRLLLFILSSFGQSRFAKLGFHLTNTILAYTHGYLINEEEKKYFPYLPPQCKLLFNC